jgi:hypothetical protein
VRRHVEDALGHRTAGSVSTPGPLRAAQSEARASAPDHAVSWQLSVLNRDV